MSICHLSFKGGTEANKKGHRCRRVILRWEDSSPNFLCFFLHREKRLPGDHLRHKHSGFHPVSSLLPLSLLLPSERWLDAQNLSQVCARATEREREYRECARRFFLFMRETLRPFGFSFSPPTSERGRRSSEESSSGFGCCQCKVPWYTDSFLVLQVADGSKVPEFSGSEF